MSSKKKLEQRKEFKEYLSIADKRVLDIKKSGIELIANDEVFVLVNNTNNYWISNHGRMTNNLHGNFYMHKTGYAHFTLSGIEKKIETYTDKLVAEHLGRQQEYVPYITLKSNTVYSIWNGIYIRCYRENNGSIMCDLWRYNKDSFAEW